MTSAEAARTMLFVPGNRPDRFAKATAAGADLVIIDLEDAVPAGGKRAAREDAREFLDQGNRVAVRVNAIGTEWHDDDVATVAEVAQAVLVPKAKAGSAFLNLGRVLDAVDTPLLALIETAAGVLDARAIAETVGVKRLVLGSFDLAADLGMDPVDREVLAPMRASLVLASAAASLTGPVDGVFAVIDDADGLRAEAAWARRLGFTGKLAIHPRQLSCIAAEFAPKSDDIAWARSVLAAFDGSDGVTRVDGAMVDKPVVQRAHRILEGLRGLR